MIIEKFGNGKLKGKIGSEDVLTIINEIRCLIKTTWKRKNNWMGHVLRGYGLLKDMLEERMFEKKRQGKQRTGMVDDHTEGSFEKRREEPRGENCGQHGCQRPV